MKLCTNNPMLTARTIEQAISATTKRENGPRRLPLSSPRGRKAEARSSRESLNDGSHPKSKVVTVAIAAVAHKTNRLRWTPSNRGSCNCETLAATRSKLQPIKNPSGTLNKLNNIASVRNSRAMRHRLAPKLKRKAISL